MSNAYAGGGFGKNSGPGSITGSRILFGANNHPFPSSPIITSTPPPSSIESHGSSDGQNLGAQPTESIFSFRSIGSHGSSSGQNLGAQATESLKFSFGLGAQPTERSHGSSDGQNLGAQATESLVFSFGSIESHGSSDGQNLGAQPTEKTSSVTTFIAPGDSTTGITANDEKEVIENSS
ncbi:nucleoporin nup124-like [Trifolium pratense]|uniref:nucleoporin nup124-like n=1 Tax=Trifolium pratense TaxID=57577 RepID=UPI001E695FFE|nr:nucleoporin nup124-like [Trifolium pratense]